jgi:hypothetical protein
MLLNEIEIGGIYIVKLNVEYRTPEEVRATEFFVKIIGIHPHLDGGIVEFVFLTDDIVHYAYPKQISTVN